MLKLLIFILLLSSIASCSKKSAKDSDVLKPTPSAISTELQVVSPVAKLYEKSESLIFTLSFPRPIFVTGNPKLKILIDSYIRLADCTLSGTTDLICSYVIGSAGDDFTLSGVEVAGLEINDAVFKDNLGNIIKPYVTQSLLAEVRIIFKDLMVWLDGSDDSTLFSDEACTLAATDGGAVRCWVDKSSGKKFTNNSTDFPKLQTSSINEKSSLLFDFNRLDVSTPVVLNNYTMFVVYDVTAWATLNYWIGSLNEATSGVGFGFGGTWTSGSAGNGIFGITKNSSRATTYVTSNVEPTSWGIATYTNNSTFRNDLENTPYIIQDTMPGGAFKRIGKREDNHSCCGHRGHIAETLIFNSTLSGSERQRIWCYLSEKYSFNLTGCSG